jgi:hypothetical protein
MTTAALRPRRLLLGLIVVATLATAAFATTASAADTPAQFYIQNPPQVTPAPDPQPCTGVYGGTLTNTVTEQGHTVTDADGTLQHYFLILTQNTREDWTDGTYLVAEFVGPLSINANPSGTFTFSGTEQSRARGTFYSATGQIIGYLDIVIEFHFTLVDGVPVSNANQFRIVTSPC